MRPRFLSHLSIRYRLPIVLCSLLLVFLVVFGIMSYVGIRKANVKAGRERLISVSDQLVHMLSGNTRNLISGGHIAGNKPAIRNFILSGGRDSVVESIKILEYLRSDSSYISSMLLNNRYEVTLSSSVKDFDHPRSFEKIIGEANIKANDFGKLGKMYRINGIIHYPIISTVVEKSQVLGYIIRWRKMNAANRSVEQIASLLGGDARLYFGNADGSLWTGEDSIEGYGSVTVFNEVFEYEEGGKDVYAMIAEIPNSEWLISVELPRKAIMEAADNYLYWIILTGLLLTIIGILVTWHVCRNVTAPLEKLTLAATEITSGNYSVEVMPERYDELGKLARSFNTMAFRLKQTNRELELKAENYKILFENNPMPMWIIDRESLHVLDVNSAAVLHYGYSREEFLNMSSVKLRPPEEAQKYIDYLSAPDPSKKSGVWRHRKKEGSIIMVDIMFDDIIYMNKDARIVLANDITEKLRIEAELIKQQINKQRIISRTTIQAQEKERAELGRELHDNINQILTSTKLYLEIAGNSESAMRENAIAKGYENINLAIAEIRQLSKQLVPPALESTLCETLKGFVEEVNSFSRSEFILFHEDFNESRLDQKVKLVLYRIIQEQVNNILKHAQARHVAIRLESNNKNILLSITDDGKGFDTSKRYQGIGMRNIHNRAKFLNGRVQVKSQPGKGCSLRVMIPLAVKNTMVLS